MAETPSPDPVLDAVRDRLPVALGAYDTQDRAVGLVIVDVINGFATVGAGALAPPAPNAQVTRMVEETDRLARLFAERDRPIAAFLDTHEPGKPEPPYPPHCELGSGEEELVSELAWLDGCPQARLYPQGLHQRLRRGDGAGKRRQPARRLGQRTWAGGHRRRWHLH